jgi:hypothetical protein
MSLANKSFKDNKTGEVVKVIDTFENIAILENKQKMDVRKLTDPNFFTEQIDINNFFNNQGAYNSLAEKIKNIPIENIVDNDGDVRGNVVMADGIRMPSVEESAVILSDPEQEKIELARKYGLAMPDNKDSLQHQNAAFAKILGDDAEDLPKIEPRKTEVNVSNVTQVEAKREYIQPTQNDPIMNMFRGVKRNVNFKMNIEISNKIPRLDFIEMMEDSYEVSIIDYLAEEFTQNLLKDPSQIKEMIKDRIKKVVYGTGVKLEETESKPEVKPEVKKQPVKKAATKKAKKEEAK